MYRDELEVSHLGVLVIPWLRTWSLAGLETLNTKNEKIYIIFELHHMNVNNVGVGII